MQPTVNKVLGRVQSLFTEGDGPLFAAGDIAELRAAPGAEAALEAILQDESQPLELRLAALEAMHQTGWTHWQTAEPRAASKVLVAAMPKDGSHNRWGLPGHFIGRLGKLLLSLPDAEESLQKLLQDQSVLTIIGSESATIQQSERYRISDLAAYLIASKRGVSWRDDRSNRNPSASTK